MKKFLLPFLTIITSSAIFNAIYTTFMVVPDERVMGAVQRIFYFHVGSAIACYFSFALVFISSIFFLATENKFWDQLNFASAEVGTLFCAITFFTGMIWGHTAWNTWFRWEPRLVTFLLLLLIFISFLIFRASTQNNNKGSNFQGKQSAILGIMGSLVVPLVWISIKFVPASQQLHPQVVENSGLKSPLFTYGMNSAIIALILLQALFILIRTKILILESNLEE